MDVKNLKIFCLKLNKLPLKLITKILFPSLSLIYFFSFFLKNFDKNNLPNLEIDALPFFVLSIFMVVLSILIASVLWHILLKASYQKINLSSSISLFLISQFGKYIPGNIAHFAARASMAKNINIPVAVSLNIIFLEIIWMIAVASLLSLYALYALYQPSQSLSFDDLFIKWLPIVGLMFFLLPWVAIELINRFFKKMFFNLFKIKKLKPPQFWVGGISIIFLVIYFFTLASVLKIESLVFFQVNNLSFFTCVSIFTLSWLAGFLIPGAPAGLGVREAVLVTFLILWMNPFSAASLALLIRLTTTLGDAAAFLLGLFIKYVFKHHGVQ